MKNLSTAARKIVCLLITLVMCFGTFGSVFAGTIKPHEVFSGTCGDNLTWTLDTETGLLSITGTGEMDDYYSRAPWYDYRSDITSVSIGGGVTSIGDFAFEECTSLTSISIPDSVTSIGDYAFSGCTSLTSITIPNSVVEIGWYAFLYCTSLTSITIPNSVVEIWWYAFYGCTSLTSITIPDSVTSIGEGAFCECTSLTSITIPDSVTGIGLYAFGDCTSLTSITIPDSVTSIGGSAFYGCTSLTTVVFLGAPPASLGTNVFIECSSDFCIYYYPEYAHLWAPNGETTWRGYPIAPYDPGYSSSIQPNADLRLISVIDRDTLDPVEDALVRVTAPNGSYQETLTDENGIADIDLDDTDQCTVSVIKDGYINALITDAQLRKGYVFNVSLTLIDQSTGISYVEYKPGGMGGRVNILHEKVSLPDNDNNEFIIRVVSSLPQEQIEEYQLLCNGRIIKTSVDYDIWAKASDFSANAPVWVRIKLANDSGYTKPVKTNLSVYHVPVTIPPTAEMTIFDGLTITIPEGVPLLGGQEYKIDFGRSPVTAVIKEDRIRLAFGTDNLFDPGDDALWNELKTSTIMRKATKAISAYEVASAFGGAVELGSAKPKVSLKALGYAEGPISGEGPVQGEITVQLSGKVGNEWQTVTAIGPVVFKAEVKVGVDVTNGFVMNFDPMSVDYYGNVELTIPKIKAAAAYGISYILNGGIYGEGSLKLKYSWLPMKYVSLKLAGEMGFETEIFLFTSNTAIWSGETMIYEHYFDEKTEEIIKHPISSDIRKYELRSRDYLTSQSKWLGSEATRDLLTARQTVTLQENIYKAARPKMIKAGDTTLMVWLADNGTRSTGNHSVLTYSVQQPNGSWSEPAAVWDDGTADFEPALGTDGNDIYVTWMDANAEFDENVTLDELSASCEISTAKFDPSLGFVQQRRMTSNGVLDMQPCVAFAGGNAYVVWSRNDNSDIIAQSGTNRIMYAPIGGTAHEITTVTDPVNWLTAGDLGGGINVFWTSDKDGDIETTADAELYASDLSGSCRTLTDNDEGETAPQFAVINGSGRLYFVSGGELMSYDGAEIVSEGVTVEGNYSIVSDGGENAYFMQNIGLGDNAQLFISRLAEDGSWNEAIVLTDTEGYAENPSAAVNADGGLTAVYVRTDAEITEDDVITSSDLCCVMMRPSHNITINDVAFDETEPAPGGELPLTLSVANNGEMDIDSFELVISAEGETVQTIAIDEHVASGETKEIEAVLDLPETAVNGDFTFEVNISEPDFDENDNTVSRRVFYADLGLKVNKLVSGENTALLAVVSNNGFIDTDALIKVRSNSADGDIITEIPLTGIEANTITTIRFNDTYLAELLNGNDMLYFTIEAAEEEYALGDNDDFISVDQKTYHTVTFLDWDGSLIYELSVEEGDAAIAPEGLEREGYVFVGWDADFSCVIEDLTVTALYEEETPVLMGDADGNGVIDTTDALLVLRCALHITGDPEEILAFCDMDGNGIIDTTDALIILRMALGIIG
ncbi:MAG: leucine-rich repeat protein [Clostridia bacterium]|nr:leucine-rich repeat protein [Clostridia bacterium]